MTRDAQDAPVTPTIVKHAPFSLSPTTSKIVEMFLRTEPGDLLTYTEITQEVGCARDAWGNCMGTARKILLGKHKIRLSCERGVGYRHLTDDDIAGAESARDVTAMHRSAARRVQTLKEGIKDPKKIPYAKLAQLQLAAHVTSPKATKVLESTKANNGSLDVGTTLDVFRKKLPLE